jgi:hypothetical protein
MASLAVGVKQNRDAKVDLFPIGNNPRAHVTALPFLGHIHAQPSS